MNFLPMTEEEIRSANLIPEGIYNFEVMSAEDKTSAKGNEMIELQLKVWDNIGKEHNIKDWLMGIPGMMYKLKHFCEVTGILGQYENGIVTSLSCTGKTGKLHLMIQKDKTGKYPDKNSVKDYEMEKKPEENILNDDIPF